MTSEIDNILNKYLKDEFRIFHVTHYSAPIRKEKLRKEFLAIVANMQK